jgi:hypothetical protein
MRIVYCKADDPKTIIPSFQKKLHDKYNIPHSEIKVDLEKNDIECGYYHIHFCKEREWEILTTTKPGTGYLTIPFNRLLLSKNGVNPYQCKLHDLFNLIKESCKTSDDTKEVKPVETKAPILTTEKNTEPPAQEKVQFKL